MLGWIARTMRMIRPRVGGTRVKRSRALAPAQCSRGARRACGMARMRHGACGMAHAAWGAGGRGACFRAVVRVWGRSGQLACLLCHVRCMISMGPVPVEILVTVGRIYIAPDTSVWQITYVIRLIPVADIRISCSAVAATVLSPPRGPFAQPSQHRAPATAALARLEVMGDPGLS